MIVGGFFIEIKMYIMKQNIKLIFYILDRVLMDKEVLYIFVVGIVSELINFVIMNLNKRVGFCNSICIDVGFIRLFILICIFIFWYELKSVYIYRIKKEKKQVYVYYVSVVDYKNVYFRFIVQG